jgi:hypothetical protein
MSTISSHRLPPANGHNGDSHLSALNPPADGAPEGWGEDEALSRELERLAAGHKELLLEAGLVGGVPAAEGEPDAREVGQLRAENARLRARVEELEQELLATAQQREQTWSEQQREYEALLEEKSEVIRGLHLKLQELKPADGQPAAGEADAADAASAPRDDLEALRQQLERQRQQLEEDEAALEQQMKQMEVTMSRERVELARQRSELQRLHNDFKHELEMAARDEKLRERLAPLQRLQQQVMSSKGTGSGRPTSSELPRPASVPNLAPPGPSAPTPPPRPGSSGLLRRLFRGGRE